MKLSNEELFEYLEFAKEFSNIAGKIMIKYFKTDSEFKYKLDQTIVTKADTDINELLIENVKKRFPNHSVDGEEDKFGSSNYVWICDPIDGTAMYARRIPVAVFSLALVIDGMPVLGVVYDPFTDNLYSAVKGNGAYINDESIKVSNAKLGDQGCFSNFDVWPTADYDIFDVLKILGKKVWFVDLGSVIRASMCVATGAFCFSIFPGTVGKYCDLAAVKVIVEEAGGKVTDLFGNNQRYDTDINGALISNGIVHDEVVSIINSCITNIKEIK